MSYTIISRPIINLGDPFVENKGSEFAANAQWIDAQWGKNESAVRRRMVRAGLEHDQWVDFVYVKVLDVARDVPSYRRYRITKAAEQGAILGDRENASTPFL